MRVLFVSSSPLKKEISIGNTFINLFSGMENVELASIYTRAGAPDSEISQAFCVTEKMIINNIFKKSSVGKRVDMTEEHGKEESALANNETKGVRFAKSKRWTVLFWMQDLVWKIGRWKKSEELNDFIKDFKPDVVFTVLSNACYLNNLILHTVKVSGAPLVLYAWDNNYSLKQFMFSPLRWIKHFIDRRSMRKVAKKADLFYVISEVQKQDYEKAFKKECRVLTKGADFDRQMPAAKEDNEILQLVFTGNIGMNRWKSLGHIANVLERINENGVKAQLRIYTGNPMTKKMEKALNKGESSFVMGSVSSSEALKIQENADFLVHVEAQDLKNKLLVRQSFSTKLVDYFSWAKPIVAYGPKGVASIEHLIRNDCAAVADNENELYEKLLNLINDKTKREELAKNAWLCGKKNHNKKDIQSELRESLEALCKG